MNPEQINQTIGIIGTIISVVFGVKSFHDNTRKFPYFALIRHFICCFIFSFLVSGYVPYIRSNPGILLPIWFSLFLGILCDADLKKPVCQGLICLLVLYGCSQRLPTLNGGQPNWMILAIMLVLFNLHSLTGFWFFGAMINQRFPQLDIAILISANYVLSMSLLLLIGYGMKP